MPRVLRRVEPSSSLSWARLLELAGAAVSQGCGGPETCLHPSLQAEGPSPALRRHILPPQWAHVPPSGTGSSHGGQLWKGSCPQQGCWGETRLPLPSPRAPAAANPSPDKNAEQAPKNVGFKVKLNLMYTQTFSCRESQRCHLSSVPSRCSGAPDLEVGQQPAAPMLVSLVSG